MIMKTNSVVYEDFNAEWPRSAASSKRKDIVLSNYFLLFPLLSDRQDW